VKNEKSEKSKENVRRSVPFANTDEPKATPPAKTTRYSEKLTQSELFKTEPAALSTP